MLYSLENKVAVFSLLLLLVISIVTVEICRRDRLRQQVTAAEFWFRGKTKIFSLAANLGALASVTYFFGGGVTYGFTFGPWYIAAAGAVFALSGFLILRMLDRFERESPMGGQASNLLVAHMRRHLEAGDLRIVLRLYTIIYFILLIVELAAGRLAFSAMLPVSPAIVTIFISVITIVIFTYLYMGGFKAALNADFAQLAILVPFICCLAFLMIKEDKTTPIKLEVFSSLNPASFLFVVATGVAYFVAGFDFFSRLNFASRPQELLARRKSFVTICLFLVFFMLVVGISYGMHLRSYRVEVGSATEFARFATSHFMNRAGMAIPLLFVVCIICMIFTTINALLLAIFQLGLESKSQLLARKNVAPVLSLGMVASAFLDLDLVSVVAVFALSLLVLPLIAVWKSFTKRGYCLPSSLKFLEGALLLSVIAFVCFYREFKFIYDHHFLIMGIVILSAVVMALLEGAKDLLTRSRK